MKAETIQTTNVNNEVGRNDPIKHDKELDNPPNTNYIIWEHANESSEKNEKFHHVDGQEIRERISQDPQNTHNVINNFYQQPRNIVIAFRAFILIVALFVVIWDMPAKPGPPGPPDNEFPDIDIMDILMGYIIPCRRAANLVQKSIAFEGYGVQIATGLREFGEKLEETGYLLQYMYSKGPSVYHSFDVEIEAMMGRLSSKRRQLGDSKYFKDGLNSLITKIREFRELVKKTRVSIIDAENARNNVEGYAVDGLRDAKKLNCHYLDRYNGEECHSLYVINNIFEHLYNIADHLDKMEMILKNYEYKLMDISAEFESAGNVEVTKTDLKFLKFAIDKSKAYLHKLRFVFSNLNS